MVVLVGVVGALRIVSLEGRKFLRADLEQLAF
jgi:hypothetical protein